MKYLAGWRAVNWSAANGCFDLVWRYCRVTLSATDGYSTTRVTPACPIYMFPTSNTGSRKYYLWKKKMIGWNIPFFITENFLGYFE